MAATPTSSIPARDLGGERRQLTVMFCDLVDSTALAERLDPEEYREVVTTYQRTAEAVIERFEGRIAQYLGDGLLVYFGYPQAHEDDARRAVHAALGIVDGLAQANRQLASTRGVTLAARIGIHTGLVVVGSIGGARQEQLALGETPNIAARLLGLAAADSVVISAATHRLVHGAFTCRDEGLHPIRGLSAPLRVFTVLAESGFQSSLEASAPGGLTRLVGREPELERLHEAWARARNGGSAVVVLSGEAGVGKSRLVEVLKGSVAGESHTRLECRCSPYYQHTALYPVIDLMQRTLGWRREDPAGEKLRALEALVGAYDIPLGEVIPLLAALLALPVSEERYPPLTLSPPRQRAKTLEALVTVLRSMASRHPLLLIMEDIHWVDPTTLELLGRLLDPHAMPRSLLVLTCRPEFRPPWEANAHWSVIALTPLTRDETLAMVTAVAGGKGLPARVLEHLVTTTDGSPLFVEELTKTVLESDLLKDAGNRYELAGPLRALAIPTTLQDSLIARLDRLGPAKAVAQLAATIGRRFSYELLQAVSTFDRETLDGALARLVDAGLVYRPSPEGRVRYLFKHALIQEAAYQTLLRSVRQQYHQRIAQTLVEKFPEVAETQPELLAHHYTEAGLAAQAVPCWQRAGQRAVERSANAEAISHLTRGLQLLSEVPEGPQRIQQELALQITLGAPLMATRGYSAGDVEKVFGRARELCRQLGEHPQLFTAIRGLRTFYQIRGDSPTAHELGLQLLRLAERVQDAALLLEAHYAVGAALFWMGKFRPAHEHFERVIALYDRRQHRSHAFVYGNDPGVVGYSYTAWTLWYLGYPEQSLQRMEAALTLARELAHPFSLAFALTYAASLYYFRREHAPTHEWAERTIALANEHGFPFWLTFGGMLRGWALAEQGRAADGIAELRRGLATWRAMGTELGRPHFLAMLAEASARAGQVAEGMAALDEATTILRAAADESYEAIDVYHLRAELLLAQGDEPGAAASLEHAIQLAQRQETKLWELRATTRLGELLRQQGRLDEARRRLAPIYGWFTEGFGTRDLAAARALLEAP
ncbi:MAG TPA: AAA family ATPase [Methylomirabilota bacterium]|nr:AAA family ATPase [Methylomirabilota bacterium]